MFVTPQEYKTRYEICMKCEHKVVRLNIPTCEVCGCILYIKTKISNQSCPKDKWKESNSKEETEPND